MIFEKGYLYHIYKQGNNKQNIFYNRDNYLFFLKKANRYILPYADILAWCLMPNHFHLMVLVNQTVTHGVTWSHPVSFAPSHPVSKLNFVTHQVTKTHLAKSHQIAKP